MMDPQTRVRIAELLIKYRAFNRIQIQELPDVWSETITSDATLAMAAFMTPSQAIPGSAQEANHTNFL